MDFPRFVFRSPGPVRYSGGACYQHHVVHSEPELSARLKDGWYASEKEAIEAAGDQAYLYGLNDDARRIMSAILARKAKEKAQAAEKLRALKKPIKQPLEEAPEADDDAPPTRAELELKASELGIKFDGRTTDARLAQRIADALKGR